METGFITISPHNEQVKQQLSKKEMVERYTVYGHALNSKIVADSLEKNGVTVIRTSLPRYKKKKVYALLDGCEIPVTITSEANGQWQIRIDDSSMAKVSEKQQIIIHDLNNRFNETITSCTWGSTGKEIVI